MKKITNITKIDDKVVTEETFNVFEYSELNEDAKYKAVDDFAPTVGDWQGEYLQDDMACILEHHNLIIDYKDICYDLGYCQGDGASFTTENNILRPENLNSKENTNPFEDYVLKELDKSQLDILIEDLEENGLTFFIKRGYSNYCHSNTCDIEYDYDYNNLKSGEDFIYKLSKDLHKEVYCELCSELESYGYEALYPNRDVVEEYINEDGTMYFKEDGEFYSHIDIDDEEGGEE